MEFATSVEEGLSLIQQYPLRYPAVWRDDDNEETRRLIVRGFPYGIFYVVALDELRVKAIYHLNRDPGVWQSRH